MTILDSLATVFTGIARSGAARTDAARTDAARTDAARSHSGDPADESGPSRRRVEDGETIDAILLALQASAGASRTVSREDVFRALGRAADVAESDRHNTDLLVAVQELREALPDDALNQLLADLITCALRDDRFEPEEARLVGAIQRAWDVDQTSAGHDASADSRNRLWSVLGQHGVAGTAWTPVHDLALIYLSVAHRSDGELARTEVDAITRKLGEWLPSALPADVLNVVDEALRRYAEGQPQETLAQSVDRIVAAVPEHQRAVVIRDLVFVAEADNVVLVEEKQLISAIAARWGIDIR